MKLRPTGALALLLLPLLNAGLPAQEIPERLVLMTRYDVDLQDDPAFREYLRLRAQAAREAGLAPDHGWSVLRADNTWLVLRTVSGLAGWDGADPLPRLVHGTPGAAVLAAAQEQLAGVDYTRESRLLAAPAAWRYEPADAAPANYAFVQEFRVTPGSEDAFDQRRADFVAFLREMGLPYRYESFRPRIGRDVVVGIVWPDDLLRYYRAFSPAVFIQRYPERFGPLSQRLRAHIKDMDTTLYTVVHDASYLP